MQASELRIGDFVFEKYSGVMIVSAINPQKRVESDNDCVYLKKQLELPSGYYNCEKIEPIPLTEEWLVKLGFEKNETGFYYKGRFTYHNEYGWKILEQWVKNWVGVSELKYVHQLQNLYFSLTGEELTI